MAREITLSIVAPDKEIATEQVTGVIAPGTEGYFGVQAGHVPLVAALRPGLLEYVSNDGRRHYVYVGGGFAEVRPDRVTILADEAQRAPEVDLERAQEDVELARQALRGEGQMTTEEATLEVERALARLKAARQAR
jgi:F-type H+-transporting ATPase subunit epsilon